MDLKTKLQTPAGADNNFYLLKSASKIKIIKIQPIFSHRQLLWQALCLSVSNTKEWLGQFFKNTLGNIFTQARSLIFRCSKLHLKIRFFFLMAPSIILLSDLEKRANYSWLQLIPKLMQEPQEILIYLKVLPKQKYVI